MRETILERIRRWWRGKRERGRMRIRRHLWERVGLKDSSRSQSEHIIDEHTAQIRRKIEKEVIRMEEDLRDWVIETLRNEIDRAKEDLRREMRQEIRAAFGMDTPAPERTERPGVSGVSPHH